MVQGPSGLLVLNGPREDIAPYLWEELSWVKWLWWASPWARCFSALGMEGWGACEVGRRICVRPIVPRLSSGAPKTQSLPVCYAQNNKPNSPSLSGQRRCSAVPYNLMLSAWCFNPSWKIRKQLYFQQACILWFNLSTVIWLAEFVMCFQALAAMVNHCNKSFKSQNFKRIQKFHSTKYT